MQRRIHNQKGKHKRSPHGFGEPIRIGVEVVRREPSPLYVGVIHRLVGGRWKRVYRSESVSSAAVAKQMARKHRHSWE